MSKIKHLIAIKDYQFSKTEVNINLGDIIEFYLDKSVPFHAEHLLIGTTKTCVNEKLLNTVCFESPLLTVSH